jgi:hypothetical protein
VSKFDFLYISPAWGTSHICGLMYFFFKHLFKYCFSINFFLSFWGSMYTYFIFFFLCSVYYSRVLLCFFFSPCFNLDVLFDILD